MTLTLARFGNLLGTDIGGMHRGKAFGKRHAGLAAATTDIPYGFTVRVMRFQPIKQRSGIVRPEVGVVSGDG